MSVGVVGNADKWRATFTDSAGTPVDPDGPVTWTVTPVQAAPQEIVQELGSDGHVGVGVFEIVYTPAVTGGYRVKARAVVQGAAQASEAVQRTVEA